MTNLKANVDQMDLQAWRDNREALEIERSLKDCDQNAAKRINTENSTNNSAPDDLASYFDVENRN
ncbi:hypothetical protein [Cellvibrio sp. UBA7671]|uniref:hypothetical protein n=1 Tax=Cellvibrio sp. UBA7671 TaxID=1946312 RepID=UPI002F3542D1